jgi:thioredoxin reductase (NADPH)
MNTLHTQLAIAGGGVGGMTAAIYAARAALRPLVLTGGKPGGQLGRSDDVEDFPGFVDGVVGRRLGELLIRQASRFGAEVRFSRILDIDLAERPFALTAGDLRVTCDALILALGASPRWLQIPGEQRLWGRGVYADALNGASHHAGEPVVVVGGGDGAAEQALYAARFASQVTVVHRRDQLRASAILERRLGANDKISIDWSSELTSIEGDSAVTAVRTRDANTGESDEIRAGAVFIAIGQTPNSELVHGQVATDLDGYVAVTPGTARTSLRGVFACGEIMDRRYRQAVTAAGTGCMAALDAERFLMHGALATGATVSGDRLVVTGELEEIVDVPFGEAISARDHGLGDPHGPPRRSELAHNPEDIGANLPHEATTDS